MTFLVVALIPPAVYGLGLLIEQHITRWRARREPS